LQIAISEELERLREEGPEDAELERARAQAEAAFAFRLVSLGGFGGRADQLNMYNVYRRQPDSFADDLGRYLRATRESVRDACRRWLDPASATILTVVPSGRRDLGLA
jgi:predicted Zn-dependent peptidase